MPEATTATTGYAQIAEESELESRENLKKTFELAQKRVVDLRFQLTQEQKTVNKLRFQLAEQERLFRETHDWNQGYIEELQNKVLQQQTKTEALEQAASERVAQTETEDSERYERRTSRSWRTMCFSNRSRPMPRRSATQHLDSRCVRFVSRLCG